MLFNYIGPVYWYLIVVFLIIVSDTKKKNDGIS
jgi:hypothetical protein